MKPNESGTPNDKIIKHNEQYYPYKVIGPNDILPLVNDYSKDLALLWEKIPHWVIKCDIARLLYIYYHGGFYMDCDCIIRKKIDLNSPLILFIEKIVPVSKLGPREIKLPDHSVRVSNYAFYAEKKHVFLKMALDECIARLLILPKKITTHDILWVCGPDVITTVYHKYKKIYHITLLDQSYLNHIGVGSWR